MMLKSFFTLLIALSFQIVFAQQISVKGIVNDNVDNAPLIGANAVLLNLKDSSVTGSVTDIDGNFQISVKKNGSYRLTISYLGYQSIDTLLKIKGEDIVINFTLKEDVTELGVTTVQGRIPPVLQKGDTTQYDAAAYKTNPDATSEDLVSKIPGMEVNNGQVKAQGENVTRVQVDGKMYFGDDASAVLKNLPAEVIDKIQVFDRRSDQAEFTGFDDGNTSKTLNIITKPSFRNGVFGRVYGAYGLEDNKYRTGLTLNKFKDQQKLTLLYQSNNVNEQNFSGEDLSGIGASSNSGGQSRQGNGGSRGGTQSESFQITPRNGIATTHAVGFNYADKWGAKVDVSGSYFFNWSKTNAFTNTFREFLLPSDSGLIYRENATQRIKNLNHRIQMRLVYSIDSNNSFIFEPRISFQQNEGLSNVSGENRENNLFLNNTLNSYNTSLSAGNISLPILYRRKLGKIGRTLSIGITPGYNYSNGNSILLSENNFVELLDSDSLNQNSILDRQGYTLRSSLAYTEPIGKKGLLQINYLSDARWDDANKNTFNFSPLSDVYNDLDTALSNVFDSRYLTQQASASYLFRTPKIQINTGLAYQWAQLDNQQQFPLEQQTERIFQSILPNARIQFNFTPKRNLRLNYRTSNNAPSVAQLQNVPDNTNPLQLRIGNENLKQDYRHDIRMRYSASNTEKGSGFFVFLSGTFTQNYIGNSTIIASNDTIVDNGIELKRGAQISRPDNLNGFMSVRLFSTYSKALSKIKSNLNINAGVNFSRTPGEVNNSLNYVNTPATSLGLVLVSNISEKIDFTISSTSNLSVSRNSLRQQLNNTFFSQNNRARINWLFWKGFVFQSDILYQLNTGLSEGFNQNFVQWNAALGYKFGKKKEADLRFSVYDILNQNRSIQRTVTETYIEDIQSNIVQRYYMLTFTYQLKFFKGE